MKRSLRTRSESNALDRHQAGRSSNCKYFFRATSSYADGIVVATDGLNITSIRSV